MTVLVGNLIDATSNESNEWWWEQTKQMFKLFLRPFLSIWRWNEAPEPGKHTDL